MTLLEERTPNPFEEVVHPRRRPTYTLEPTSIAWDAVAFSLRGVRDGVVCVPRSMLGQFFDDLDHGTLDHDIESFLAAPPAGRVLRNAGQTARPGLFDSIESGAMVPRERVPTRGVLGGIGGGGTPADARRNKNRRHPRRLPKPAHLLVGAVAVVTVGIGVAVAASRQDSTKVAVTEQTQPTTATTVIGNTTCAVDLCGVWPADAVDRSGAHYSQTFFITAVDARGAIMGTDETGGVVFALSGTISGTQLELTVSNAGYTSNSEATLSGSGLAKTMAGTFSDSNQNSGSFTATRTSLTR